MADAAIWISLIVAVIIVYGQLSHAEFLDYDDQGYVYENQQVQAGLTLANLKWSLTAVVVGNWAPVTLLSHMFMCQFFGLEAGAHHLLNVLFHMLASVLLFAVMKRATGGRWPSAVVAFLFALHPQHVESVAWISERKDVLSAFFCILALYAYVRYTESGGMRQYLFVIAAFCLGLMSKAMLVTFPFALILFDVWPLRRFSFPKVFREKIPLFVLAGATAIGTYVAQKSSGAFSVVALPLRVENALTSYVIYIAQMIYPVRLGAVYPYPESIPLWQAGGALAILIGISAAALYTWRTRPYVASGWFWYLGMMVPVIGLIQVGGQARADRYVYLPSIGLFWIIAWGAMDLIKYRPSLRPVAGLAAVTACCACAFLSWVQVGYWQNSIALFQHSIDLSANNYWAHFNLGYAHYIRGNRLMSGGRGVEAMTEFQEALRVWPNYPEAENNIGILLAQSPGHSAEAITHFQAALRLDPKLVTAHKNLGLLFASLPGHTSDAINQLEAANKLQPDPEIAQTIERLRSGKNVSP